jgi:glycosyltransferase involved in cell wall biosynthesis
MSQQDAMVDVPVISIVTPSYNQGEFLEETLVSVLSQEGDFCLDYVVVDGDSSDRSPQIIRNYAGQVEGGQWPVRCRGIRFRWVSERDRGQTDALMKGFRLAEGDILAWLNSDDVYLSGTLQTVAEFFSNHRDVALLYGAAHYCDAAGEIIGSYPTGEFDFHKLAWFNFFCQPSTFFRRKAFAAVGGLDETLHYAMDYDLFTRLALQFRCAYLPGLLSKYRLHEEAKTMRNDILHENHEEALRVAMKHFGWAPLNRVYGACYYEKLLRWPASRSLAMGAALLCTPFRSLRLNQGVRRADLQLLSLANFRKLFKGRDAILRG